MSSAGVISAAGAAPEYSSHGEPVQRKTSRSGSSEYDDKEKQASAVHDARVAEDEQEAEAAHDRQHRVYERFRPFILGGLALLILGWWISATVLKATRHRWYKLS
jgi:concentrative nucleoside transporter, CNT family